MKTGHPFSPPATGAQIGERELIAMMAMLMAMQAFGIDAMLPALGAIAQDLAIPGNERQLVVGVYLLGSGIGAIIPGSLADRFGRRPVLAVCLIFYIAMSIACALTQDFSQLIGLRLVQAVGSAGLSVLPAAIIRDRVGGDKMARMMSLIMMVFLLVPVIAPTIGSLILQIASWRWIFGAMAVNGVVVGVWFWLRLPESLHPEDRQEIRPSVIFRNMKESLYRRGTIGYVLGSALVFGGLFGFINSAQQLIGEHFGAAELFPLIFGASAATMIFSNLINSRIVERFGARRVSQIALLAFIAVAGLQVLSSFEAEQSLWHFVPLMAANMALLGFVGANFGSIAMQPFYHIAGAASSAQGFVRMASGALLGAAIGYAYDNSARPLALALLLSGLLSLVLVLFSERGKLFTRPNAPNPAE